MVRPHDAILNAQKSITLKLNEPEVDSENPWADDLLGRKDIATRLTNLVANQVPPLTISLHGQWGTGKTFMLRRWQNDLERQGYKAIYFNAWEDDFCDDPLLAFVGQLSDYFKRAGLGEWAEQAVKIAIPLIRDSLLGILKTTTGISVDWDQLAQNGESLLDKYQEQRATKDKLKEELAILAEKVQNDTGHPLVFIVDELDRCRPTFAIELLERVKHIFDVRNMVFVFGLNRDELCKSLTSVYGEIDADVYIRRFFDFEFNLPEVDSRSLALSLMEKYGLDTLPQVLYLGVVRNNADDYQGFIQMCARLWSGLGFSLRDVDYGIRLLALLAKSGATSTPAQPHLLSLLIGFKFKKPELYHSLISGNFRTSDIVDYVTRESTADLNARDFEFYLDRIEGFLYCADSTNTEVGERGGPAYDELDREVGGSSGTRSLYLSMRAQNADPRRRDQIKRAILDGRDLYVRGNVFGALAALIDTYQSDLRR